MNSVSNKVTDYIHLASNLSLLTTVKYLQWNRGFIPTIIFWFIAGITIHKIPLIVLHSTEHELHDNKSVMKSIFNVRNTKSGKSSSSNTISSHWYRCINLPCSLKMCIHNMHLMRQIIAKNKAKTKKACDITVRWMTVRMTCISSSSSEKCLFVVKKHLLVKRQALQRHKAPDRRDRQENKTHQTLMPKMLPLIASYSNQILTDTVNLYLSLRKVGVYVPFTGYCDYFGQREWENTAFEVTARCAYILMWICSLCKHWWNTAWEDNKLI